MAKTAAMPIRRRAQANTAISNNAFDESRMTVGYANATLRWSGLRGGILLVWLTIQRYAASAGQSPSHGEPAV